MIRLGRESNLTEVEVIEKAVAFFGPSGVGMQVVEQEDCCARFEGAGGYVSIQVAKPKDRQALDVTAEGREWDYQIRQFIGEL